MRTNIYYIILCLCALCVSSCGKEDVLENKIDFSSDYEIKDDPNDPIQHHKYLIYQNMEFLYSLMIPYRLLLQEPTTTENLYTDMKHST